MTASTPRGRAITSVVLIVVASILLPLAGVTVWVRNLVLDSGRYVDTVEPLADDPAVQEAVATRVSVAVVDALDVQQRAEEALPDKAKFLAAPIAAGAQELVHTATLRLLETDQFQTVWSFANREAHDQIVHALTGRKIAGLTTSDGKVVLNLGPLAAEVAKQLGDLGIGVPKNVDVSRLNVKFVLIDSGDLASVQTYARLLDRLAWILPVLVVGLYAAAILLDRRRRTALMRVGVGITVAMVVMLVAYGFARTTYLDNLPPSPTGGHEAGAAVFDTVTRFVERGIRTLLVLGILVWLAAWLAGPSKAARAVRTHWTRLVGRAGAGVGEAVEIGPVSRWVGAHTTGLRIALFAGIGLLLFAWDRPTGLVVLGLGVLAVVGLGVIQMIAAGAEGEDVMASITDDAPETRDDTADVS